ncbi:MAG TPA: hypothetical protein VEO01_19540 [Pseudonocardiaceae bacterium]|nr:hypothetical protein [Pseudonocardiaceae bacterium]
MPTPRATDGTKGGTKGGPNQRGSSGDLMLPSAVAKLLPTPQAHDGRDTSPVLPSMETARLRVSQGKSNLEDSIALLPTPRAADRHATMGAPGAARHVAAGNGSLVETLGVHLLPTPTARDWKGENQRRDRSCLPGALPGGSTPPPSDGGNASSDGQLLFPGWPDPKVD